jgi:hypothetical protein
MATYLQGVTDFIPDYQPFQPDLNFYGQLLQTKQTQYDTNWKQLNNLYGQLYGAELTHDLNIKKKDELLKQIDFNLRRVSGMDLSLEQNVNQAMQVFRPFYEDKYLMKDMAYTKNWMNTYNGAQNLVNSKDPLQREKHWKLGIQGLELRRQMFKDSTLEETLSIDNAQYTPAVNVNRAYLDLIKKYNIKDVIEKVPDKSGLYFVEKKNGDLIMPGLLQLFQAEYANRNDIQEMYREKAFVERMSYAYQNADNFGGSKLESEKYYIKDKLKYIAEYAKKKNNEAQSNLNNTQNLQSQLEQEVKKGNVNPSQRSYAERLQEAFKVETVIYEDAKKLNEQVNDGFATKNIQGNVSSFEDITDLELARLKADAGYAQIAAEEDMIATAQGYAFSNASIKYSANPVGLENLRHKNALYRQTVAAETRKKALEQIAEDKLKLAGVKQALADGYISWDPVTNKIIDDPQYNGFNLITKKPNDAGGSTGGDYTFDQLNERLENDYLEQNAITPVNDIMKLIKMGVEQDKFSPYELATLLKTFPVGDTDDATIAKVLKEGSKGNKAIITEVWNKIYNKYSKNTTDFAKSAVGTGQIFGTNNILNNWAFKHKGDKFSNLIYQTKSQESIQDLERSIQAVNRVDERNYEKIRKKFTEDVTYLVNNATKKNPNYTYDQNKIDRAVDRMMYRYIHDNNGNNTDFGKNEELAEQEVENILGFTIGKTTNKAKDISWYQYLVPLWAGYDAYNDREDVKERASWVSDVFDVSFEDLTGLPADKGGLETYGITVFGGKDQYGIGSEIAYMKAMPRYRNDPGNKAAEEMFKIINGIKWGQDDNRFRITVGGNVLPSEDQKGETGISEAEALKIIEYMRSNMNYGPAKMEPFFIGSSDVAMENADLGSMILKAPRSVLEEVLKGVGDSDASSQAVKDKIDLLYQNGITFIAPRDYWKGNSLFNKSIPTPTELTLMHEPIKYFDPLNSGEYTISKDPQANNYSVSGAYYAMQGLDDKNPGMPVRVEFNKPLEAASGRFIGDEEKMMREQFNNTYLINLETFRQIHASGDEEAIKNAEKYFGAKVDNPMWNIKLNQD